MREASRDPGRIEHMLLAIEKIEAYTNGINYRMLLQKTSKTLSHLCKSC